jgi:uncharacterized protein (DUF302 family)
MTYYIARQVNGTFEAAIARVTEALKVEGFGVLTEIDVAKTLKTKLDKEFRPYRILGACNPSLAFQALSAEDKVGVMLPCNVIVQTLADGRIEVAAIDPTAAMEAIGNPALTPIAATVREKLQRAIASL